MVLLAIYISAGLLLNLPQCSYQSCTDGTARQCKEAEFVPGSNFAGEGFDITKMKRKSAFVIDMNTWQRKDKTCNLCVNPYLENKKQKLPLSVVDWRPSQRCNMKVSSKLHSSSESVVASSTSSVENNWGVNLDLNFGPVKASYMMAGTQSKLAEYAMAKSKSDKFSFTSHSMSCDYYSYRVSGKPKLHKEFRSAVQNLPKIYSPEYKQHFYRLIETFGTHYLAKVKLGGNIESVTSIKQCLTQLEGLSVEEVKMCLDVEASLSVGGKSAKSETKHCNNDKDQTESKSSFASRYSDRMTEIWGGQTTEPELLFSATKDPSAYKEWLNSLPQYPDIVSYSLESLHELLPVNSPARKNLRAAISHYILERALWQNCSKPCEVGIKSHRDPCTCNCHNQDGVGLGCCPQKRGMAHVVINVQRATNLWGDSTTATDGYVKVFLDKQMIGQTRAIPNNNNPKWAFSIHLGTVDIVGKKVRFEVWDEDNKWDDDLLGSCEQFLTAGKKEDLCNLPYGRLYFKWEVTCAPSLGGSKCMDYIPSPMAPHLQQVYISCNSHPFPEAILKKMGVFVEKSSLQSNQSFNAERKWFGGT